VTHLLQAIDSFTCIAAIPTKGDKHQRDTFIDRFTCIAAIPTKELSVSLKSSSELHDLLFSS
jgi:hypothetical protein